LMIRWAYSGKWLASCSDNGIVMIWDLDPYIALIFTHDIIYQTPDDNTLLVSVEA
ncbi:hypothetical protein BU17DRAFT_52382, partial [Hysterangium stoloniferum]